MDIAVTTNKNEPYLKNEWVDGAHYWLNEIEAALSEFVIHYDHQLFSNSPLRLSFVRIKDADDVIELKVAKAEFIDNDKKIHKINLYPMKEG